jgi:hypothetical protein
MTVHGLGKHSNVQQIHLAQEEANHFGCRTHEDGSSAEGKMGESQSQQGDEKVNESEFCGFAGFSLQLLQ